LDESRSHGKNSKAVDEVRINGFLCRNEQILALARRHGVQDGIEELVCSLARAKLDEADALLRQVDAGWSPPPFDPLLVAQALGIRCLAVDRDDLEDAMIYAPQGQPTILFQQKRAGVRRRFSLFHEIAHTLFPDFEPAYRQRRRPLFDPDGQLEYLCDKAAAEFLMPMDLFWVDLLEKGFGATRLPALCRRYGASVEAVALRMVQADMQPCAVALFGQRRLPQKRQKRQKHLELVLGDSDVGMPSNTRVFYCAQSATFRDYGLSLPRLMRLSPGHLILRTARARRMKAGEIELELGRGRRLSFYAEAVPLAAKRRQGKASVLVFLYPL
jgi:Zn-dependent peptidase ImmA (M78 family)